MGSLTRTLLTAERALRAAPAHLRRAAVYRRALQAHEAVLDAVDAAARDGDMLHHARAAGGATRARNARSEELDAALLVVARRLYASNGRQWHRGDSMRIREAADTKLFATDERIRRIKRRIERE